MALAGCSEQREKIADLFRWGDTRMEHEVKKVDTKAGEELDMSKMTVESLKKQGVKMTEIPPEAVFVSPERQQISGVRFGRAEYRNLERVIRTVGRMEFDEKKISTVNPKIGGWIDELYVDYTGKMVRKGQPLLSIYSPELVSRPGRSSSGLESQKNSERQPHLRCGRRGGQTSPGSPQTVAPLGHHPQAA